MRLVALKEAGFPLRHMLIWAKNNHVLGGSAYHYQDEPVLYGWVEAVRGDHDAAIPRRNGDSTRGA